MRALHRKLLRDLWRMRSQALAVALVVAAGVTTYGMLAATVSSLSASRDAFFAQQRLADVFVSLKRAPRPLLQRLAEIPGVARVEGGIQAAAKLEIAGFGEPVAGQVIAYGEPARMQLNRVRLMQGRAPAPARGDEVVVSVPFAKAHALGVGDSLGMILNGRRQRLTIVGLGLAPEHVIQANPGSLVPDPKRYGVLWMSEQALADAYDMAGAFNSAALTLGAGVRPESVIAAVDRLLQRYGGSGAYPRAEQLSYRMLSDEIAALKIMGMVFTAVFLAVTAFLLNVVITRIVHGQREQIALIKAFGYGNLTVGVHYAQLIGLIILAGAALGGPLAWWLADTLATMYTRFFHFPELIGGFPAAEILSATGLMLAAGLLGALRALRQAVGLPPAEAMRPESPRVFRVALVERIGLRRFLAQPSRMILRNIERTPIKSAFTVLGIALALGTMLLTSFMNDSFFHVVQLRFERAQRQDLTVSFIEPRGREALHALRGVPGVLHAEAIRQLPVRFNGPQGTERSLIQAAEPTARLSRLLDREGREVPIPPAGLVLTDYLAEQLGVAAGDRVVVEPLEGAAPAQAVPVVALVSEFLGVSGYMSVDALNRLAGRGELLSGALLRIDAGQRERVIDALKDLPAVAGVTDRRLEIETFYQERAASLLFTTLVAGVLAAAIALGVVYNSAAITLMERSLELASLRVLGFTQHEIGYILLGELALLVLIAIAPGMLLGYGLCQVLAQSMWDEQYRLPVVVQADTYAQAVAVILATAVASALLVRRRLGRLDLIAVLKTRE